MWRIDPDNVLHHLPGADDIVWVPSDQMVVYRADLPLQGRQVWEQTVAFTLEEQLLHRVDTMHFAIGQPDDRVGIPVICMPLGLMQEWMDLLARQSIRPRVVYPDFLAIPFDQQKNQVVVWQQDAWCCLRLSLQEAINGSVAWVRSIVDLTSSADQLKIFSDCPQALPEDWRSLAEPLPHSLEKLMTDAGEQPLPVSVLQGVFKPSAQIVTLLKPWSWAATILLLLSALFLTDLQIKAYSFDAQATTMKKATKRVFNAYFPNEKLAGADVRAYTTQLLAQIQDDVTEGQTATWQLMLKVEPVFSSCAACIVERIKLASGALKIEISAAEELASIVSRVNSLADIKVQSEPLSAPKGRQKARLILAPDRKT